MAPARIDHPAQAAEGPTIKHDISVPVSAIRDFVASTDAALQRAPGIRLVDFGHLGDGNLHYNVRARRARTRSSLRHEAEVNAIVYDTVARATARSPPSTASAG